MFQEDRLLLPPIYPQFFRVVKFEDYYLKGYMIVNNHNLWITGRKKLFR